MLELIDIFLHLDKYLGTVAASWGPWTLALLFIIVFCETGLVVTPFLPGDSLLFAAGALTVQGFFGVTELIVLLVVAAVLGDALNYSVGKWFGPKVFREHSRWFRPEYIRRTEQYFQKYGPKTIVIARFVPIVRTFAPFLAGIGTMSYARFAVYNVAGAVLWVCSFALAGHFFAHTPFVKNNFTLVVLAIIVLSLVPIALEALKARREKLSAMSAR